MSALFRVLLALITIASMTLECEMSTTYTPDPTNDPTSITIPSDGDGPGIKAADVNPPIEALADQVAARRMKVDAFTANGTWTCPVNVTKVIITGYGGGGGGGGGAGGANSTSKGASGGAGGGGAIQGTLIVTVVPGTTYNVTIGAGGAGGAAGAIDSEGTIGGAGGDTFINASGNPGFQGAGKGGGGIRSSDVTTTSGLAFGGSPVNHGHNGHSAITVSIGTAAALTYARIRSKPMGEGGDSFIAVASETTGARGGGSITGNQSTDGGANGTDGATHHAGWGGGSGGCGPGTMAGGSSQGGAGGSGNDGGAGVAGSAGTAGSANSGAGGGGGGGGGCGTSGSTGGAGAAGGSGKLWIIYQGVQAVVA